MTGCIGKIWLEDILFSKILSKKKKESNLSLFCQGGKLVIMRKTASSFLWCFCNPYRLVQFSRWPHIYIDHKLLHYDIWHKSNIPRISSLSLTAFMSVMYSGLILWYLMNFTSNSYGGFSLKQKGEGVIIQGFIDSSSKKRKTWFHPSWCHLKNRKDVEAIHTGTQQFSKNFIIQNWEILQKQIKTYIFSVWKEISPKFFII